MMKGYEAKKYIRSAFKKKHKQEHYMSSELYADYLEIKICSLYNFIEKREKKIPKSIYNRQGNPVSIVDNVRESTQRTEFREIKKEIINIK